MRWLLDRTAVALFIAIALPLLASCSSQSGSGAMKPSSTPTTANSNPPDGQLRKATLGGGCFWCTEAVFQQLKGVKSVLPGYSGGQSAKPTYEEVCSGTSGHAEVVQIEYDPSAVTFADLLEVFFKTHDPTTLNRQGNDVGTQYRSVIFYHDDEQRQVAERVKRELNAAGIFDGPIVTEIAPYKGFYAAEDYHHDYYRRNPNQAYCRFLIAPKLEKLRHVFRDKLRDAE